METLTCWISCFLLGTRCGHFFVFQSRESEKESERTQGNRKELSEAVIASRLVEEGGKENNLPSSMESNYCRNERFTNNERYHLWPYRQ